MPLLWEAVKLRGTRSRIKGIKSCAASLHLLGLGKLSMIYKGDSNRHMVRVHPDGPFKAKADKGLLRSLPDTHVQELSLKSTCNEEAAMAFSC